MNLERFSPEEDRLILKYRDAGFPYAAISEKMAAKGYSRTIGTIRMRYRRLKEKEAENAIQN